MKKVWIISYPIFFLLMMAIPSLAQEKINTTAPYGMRIFLHGNQKMQDVPFGFSEWIILPSVTTDPRQIVALVGTTFEGESWGIETHIGFDWTNNVVSPIFDGDIFISFQNLIGLPISSWSDLEWILLESNIQKSELHVYSQLDYDLPLGLGQIGIETEDVFSPVENTFAIGPHYIFPVGNKNRIMISYLFGTTNQLWIRSFINF